MPSSSLLIVDDDDLTREVLALLAADAGYNVTTAESGSDALEYLPSPAPGTILCDLQMPGISGDTLARLLRNSCGLETILLAMSGSSVAPETILSFDGFLLKPFAIEELNAVIERVVSRQAQSAPRPLSAHASPSPLNQSIYASLAKSMPATQLRALYELCLEDADKRIGLMRHYAQARDADAFTRAAHAIKGGCGMVGASELAALAGTMETDGLPPVGNTAPLEEFLEASLRLRRMLDAHTT